MLGLHFFQLGAEIFAFFSHFRSMGCACVFEWMCVYKHQRPRLSDGSVELNIPSSSHITRIYTYAKLETE